MEDICNKLHRRLKREFRYGLVWGKSVKFGGQRVGLTHIMQDEDVLTIIKRKGMGFLVKKTKMDQEKKKKT